MTPRPDAPVATIMSWPVVTIDHEATLAEAAEALANDVVGALLVTSRGRPAGVLSERDVTVHVAAGTDLAHVLVGEAMAVEPVTVSPDTTVLAAALEMVDADVRHLPVLQDDRIAGMVSMRDVVAVLAAALGTRDVVLPAGGRVVFRGR